MGKNPWVDLHKQIQRTISDAGVAKIAKITSRDSNGNYTCLTLDQLTISSVKNQTRTKWQVNQWVVLECIGGDWIITGLSPQRGAE